MTNNIDLRPKLHDKIEFTVQGCLKDGVVTRVGKKAVKDRNRCWIKNNSDETSYDFVNEVEHWRKTGSFKSVAFENSVRTSSCTALKDKDEIGVLHMKSWSTIPGLEGEQDPAPELDHHEEVPGGLEEQLISTKGMDAQNVFATEVPKKHHDHPKIVEAKREELRRWHEYETIDQVSQTENMQVISSRWVITEKDGGQFKARLVVRGF